MDVTIQIRTDRKTKREAQTILAALGLNLSTAINMFLMQVIRTNGIPFDVITENGMTLLEERKMLKELEWARKYGKKYPSTKELHDDILKKKRKQPA